MATSQRMMGQPSRQGTVLSVAWLLLIAAVAALSAWLFVNAKETQLRLMLRQPHASLEVGDTVQAAAASPVAPAAVAAPPPAAVVAEAPAKPPAGLRQFTAPPPDKSQPMAPAPSAQQRPNVATEALAMAPPVPSMNAPSVNSGLGTPAMGTELAAAPPPPVRSSVRPIAAVEPPLTQTVDGMILPAVSADRRKPWQVYSAAFDPRDQRPRIALVVTGLGLSKTATEAALESLPPPVSLAFSPYSSDPGSWVRASRAAGHETLLTLPLEPANYPQSDPGPYTLLTGLTERENVTRMRWVMGRAQGYSGLVGEFGQKFTTSSRYLLPVMSEMRDRGLLYVDSRIVPDSIVGRTARDMGVPRALNDRFLDAVAERDAIDQRLLEVERMAKARGTAVAFASPFPITLDRLNAWIPTLEQKGLALAPVSAVVDRQPDK